MLIVDAHCDTISKILDENKQLLENDLQIDLERMRKHGNYLQFFAVFIDPCFDSAYAMKRAVAIIDKYYEQMHINREYISHCNNYSDIIKALEEGKAASILSIEGAEALSGQLASLRIFYRLGVRSLCLTWNYRNELADGVKDSSTGGGLTPFGRDVVREMNELGMIIDLSHISEKGFWDVINLSRDPIIVSHSNSKTICNHPRNLTDEQLMAVKKNNGVVGINFYPDFLNNSGSATVKDIMRHIEHIAGLIGCDHIGLGSDFDGIEKTPADIAGVQNLDTVLNELGRHNYSDEQIIKIAGMNFMRIIKEILK